MLRGEKQRQAPRGDSYRTAPPRRGHEEALRGGYAIKEGRALAVSRARAELQLSRNSLPTSAM